jgi:hypothetical protein
VTARDHGIPISQHTGAMIQPGARCSGYRTAEHIRQQSKHGVGEINQRDKDDQHGDNIEQKLKTGAGALHDGVDRAARGLFDLVEPAAGVLALGVGHHEQADDDRRRCAEHRTNGDVARGVRDGLGEDRSIEHNTVPAMPAMPPVMTINISLRDSLSR